jgi:hypothetical protein
MRPAGIVTVTSGLRAAAPHSHLAQLMLRFGRRSPDTRCGRAGEEASARVILVTSAEPGQSAGRTTMVEHRRVGEITNGV